MSAPLAPWSKAISAVLADGRWHTRDELFAAALPTIPPGRAARRGELDREINRASRGAEPAPRRKGDAHYTGARTIVRGVLRSAVIRGRVERDGDRYRLTPKGRR